MPDNFPIGGGVFIFPIAFILQDIVTEVYGYARSRHVSVATSVGILHIQ
ncbi:VUT family protein [Piscirickettsia salmonis]|nr:VUT family protein [Piscirickettsia salmonis]